jgi:hypothetical protein
LVEGDVGVVIRDFVPATEYDFAHFSRSGLVIADCSEDALVGLGAEGNEVGAAVVFETGEADGMAVVLGGVVGHRVNV